MALTPTVVVYANASDFDVSGSVNATYSIAREASGSNSSGITSTDGRAGQSFTTSYTCYQSFLAFDTSAVPVVSALTATFKTTGASVGGAPNQTEVMELSRFDWTGSSVSNFRKGTELAALTVAGSGTKPNANNSAFSLSLSAGAFSSSSELKFVLAAQDQRLGNAPPTTGSRTLWAADASGTADDPYLTLTPVTTEQQFTGAGTTVQWQVPAGVISLLGLHGWGAGQGGTVSTSQEGGGSGGDYALTGNHAVTPGETLHVRVGAGGGPGVNGGDSWVSRNSDGSSPIVLAKGGGSGSSNVGGTTFAGGAGAAAQGGGGSRGGSGGGGGAGSSAAGDPGLNTGGANADGKSGGAGGAPNGGTAGSGGTSGNPGTSGGNVAETGGGGGGGGGGGSGANGAGGGIPSGGAGGGGNSGGNAGTGARGEVVIVYVTPAAAPSLYPPFPRRPSALLRM